jgi:hypothetical protein
MSELELLKLELLFPDRSNDFFVELAPSFKLLYFSGFLGVVTDSVEISESWEISLSMALRSFFNDSRSLLD